MTSVQKAIFPGLVAGCMFLVLIASLIASPKVAWASYAQNRPAAAVKATATPAADQGQDTNTQQQAAAAEKNNSTDESASTGECPVSSTYPESIKQWCGFIAQYAKHNGLDPNLVAAVMLQESGGNPKAYSKSGAVGLLQVMPKDGLASQFMCAAGPCFASRPSIDELYDPEFNISYGTQMLSGLIEKYGDVREALRAYGPMNVGYYYADIILGILQRYQ